MARVSFLRAGGRAGDDMGLQGLAGRMREVVEERAIPAWLGCADPEAGGYRVGADPAVRASHHLVSTARLLWVFSRAYRHTGARDPRLIEAARLGYRCLVERLQDTAEGGFFWRVPVESGGPGADTGKHLYGQSFAIYGLVEYAGASGEDEPLRLAEEAFGLVSEKARDHQHGGWTEQFDRHWRPETRKGLGPLRYTGLKTTDGDMHWMEALTSLALATGSARVMADLAEGLDLSARHFFRQIPFDRTRLRREDWSRRERWRPTDIDWGHLVEFAWLRIEAERALGREPSARFLARALRLARLFGRDPAGGLVHRNWPIWRKVNRFKEWWVQAEYLAALVTATGLDGGQRFERDLCDFVTWLLDVHICPETGIWIDESGRRHDTMKAGYHEMRAMMMLVEAHAPPRGPGPESGARCP